MSGIEIPALRGRRRDDRAGAPGPGRRSLACALAISAAFVAASVGGARQAHAYPQWQLSNEAVRCAQCHFSPGGGGLVNDYGRDAMGGDQTTFGGNGAFLYGISPLPSWLAVGGDFRGAYVVEDQATSTGTKQAVFPMQADLQMRVAVGDFSAYASGGLRGQVRPDSDLVPDQNYRPISTSRLISREHYLMWRPSSTGWYARAGRFYAPFGLRMAEHVLYVRRDLGFNQLEESYNLSVGQIGDRSEVHLTAFAPDFVRHLGARSYGVAVYAEQRGFDDTALLAGQGKLDVNDDVTRAIGGLVGKLFIAPGKTLLFAETDAVRLVTPGGDSTQFVGAFGASLLPGHGLMATVIGERRQTDIRVSGTATNAGTLLVNWMPYAHTELELMGRLQAPSGADTTKTVLLQIHFIL